MIFTVLSFVFVIGILVIVHEFGHFIVAKKFGVRVEQFSIGLPPKMLTLFTRGDTEYILSWLPFGGYVKMAGDLADENPSGAEYEFQSKTPGQRFWIILAGPAMNYIFAFFLFAAIIYFSGVSIPNTTRIDVAHGSYAAQVGLQTGDQLIAIDNISIGSWRDVAEQLEIRQNQTVSVTVKRHDEMIKINQIDLAKHATKDWGLLPLIGTTVGGVQKDSPADLAGLQKKDVITHISVSRIDCLALMSELITPADRFGLVRKDVIATINTKHVESWEDMSNIIYQSANVELLFTIQRGGKTFEVPITPRSGKIPDENNDLRDVGLIGIRMDFLKESISPLTAIMRGGEITIDSSFMMMTFLKKIFSGHFNKDMIGGPLAIGQYAGESARWGFSSLLIFMASLSVQLAVLNLFIPIPVLDGGQILFILVEKLRGRRLSNESRLRFAQIGILVLLMLMVVVTFFDITR